jgi:hypothetical protein
MRQSDFYNHQARANVCCVQGKCMGTDGLSKFTKCIAVWPKREQKTHQTVHFQQNSNFQTSNKLPIRDLFVFASIWLNGHKSPVQCCVTHLTCTQCRVSNQGVCSHLSLGLCIVTYTYNLWAVSWSSSKTCVQEWHGMYMDRLNHEMSICENVTWKPTKYSCLRLLSDCTMEKRVNLFQNGAVCVHYTCKMV